MSLYSVEVCFLSLVTGFSAMSAHLSVSAQLAFTAKHCSNHSGLSFYSPTIKVSENHQFKAFLWFTKFPKTFTVLCHCMSIINPYILGWHLTLDESKHRFTGYNSRLRQRPTGDWGESRGEVGQSCRGLLCIVVYFSSTVHSSLLLLSSTP